MVEQRWGSSAEGNVEISKQIYQKIHDSWTPSCLFTKITSSLDEYDTDQRGSFSDMARSNTLSLGKLSFN